MNHFSLIVMLVFLFSCNPVQEEANKKLPNIQATPDDLSSCNPVQEEANKKLPNIQATLDDIALFFGIKKVNPNNFRDLNLMLFDSEDYPKHSKKEPFMYYSLDNTVTRNSVLVKQDFFSILVLDCPYDSSVGLFYKQNDQKSVKLIEHKYYPDNVLFYPLNDNTLVCQYRWDNMRVDSKSVRVYYFSEQKQDCSNTDM